MGVVQLAAGPGLWCFGTVVATSASAEQAVPIGSGWRGAQGIMLAVWRDLGDISVNKGVEE